MSNNQKHRSILYRWLLDNHFNDAGYFADVGHYLYVKEG